MKRKAEILREVGALAREMAGALRIAQRRGVTHLPRPQVPAIGSEETEPAPREERVELPPTDLGKEARLNHLRQQALECTRCRLAQGRNQVVFGAGSRSGRIMFIGERPGAEENRTGIPFVGRAGQLLTRMLAAVGLGRTDVYITNIVKCRPPQNRDPRPDEVAACRPFLSAQLDIIRPDLIVALGRPSAQSLLNDKRSLGVLRKSIHKFGQTDLLVTYHPAFLLRSPARKKMAWQDLLLLVDMAVKKGLREALPPPWWRF